jgi:hypothetical protein
MLFAQPLVSLDEFESRSGWHLRPEGLCQGEVCVPLRSSPTLGELLDVRVPASALGMPVVEDGDLVALGPRAFQPTLPSAEAPPLVLPDVHGEPFDLASLRGTKVLLLAWASW